jgi:exonuclease SbcC
LKRIGAAVSDVCEVNLEFDLDGDKYLINRKMKGKNFQTTASATINGKSAATSTKSVTELIEERLGMDYQAFYTSVFTKQKELNALSALDPSKRKKLILRMLNIDSIDKAIDSLRRNVKEFKIRLEETRSRLIDKDGKSVLETTKTKIIEHEEITKTISLTISDMEKQKVTMQKSLKKLEISRAKQRKLREEFNEIKTKLTKCKTNLENKTQRQSKVEQELKGLKKFEDELHKLEPKIKEWKIVKVKKAELDEIQDKFIRAEELRKQFSKLEEQIKKYNTQLQKADVELKKFDNLEKDMEKCQEELKKVNDGLDEQNKNISRASSEQNQLHREMKKLQDKLQEIQALGPESKCPTCERELKDQYKFLEDKFNNELLELTQKQDDVRKSLGESQFKLADSEKHKEALKKREKYLNSEFSKRAVVEESIKGYNNTLKENNSQKDDLFKKLKEYKDLEFDPKEYEKIKKNFQELEGVNEEYISINERVESKPKLVQELDELKTAQNKLTAEKTEIEEHLEKLGFNEQMAEQLEADYEEAGKLLKQHELSLKERENEKILHQKDIEQLKAKINELLESEKKAVEHEDKLRYLTTLDHVLNNFKSYMIGRISPTLTQFASDLFRALTDGKYNRLEVDRDYNVSIYDNGNDYPLERFSGGEEDLANLCLRLAISQVITTQSGTSGPNFVILDEIFGSQDLNRKRNLLQTLNGLSNKFRQIFLITHIEDVKDYIGFNISVTENDDGTSSVKVLT